MVTRGSTRSGVLCVGALAAVTLLAAAALVACGSGGGGSVSIEVTPAPQTETTVEAKVGDTVVVSLDANATTGYSWAFTAGDTFTIESSQYQEGTHPEGVVGTGGTQIVTLKVTRAGESDLTGMYRQQWNSPSPDSEPDFSMTVVSTD